MYKSIIFSIIIQGLNPAVSEYLKNQILNGDKYRIYI